ncbi:MAG: hypothetical protein BAJALOKI2v1_230022 [Promethearchaeota archaeon]|nr:MAG: hypothetical protein BAJALOKI2v1_230022 [Candidatus Lokiarchaeota archaeon]
MILSHEVNATKPDPKIFKIAIKKAKSKPRDIIYVDDGLNNIKAASKLGINSIQFHSTSQVIDKLKELGINITFQP